MSTIIRNINDKVTFFQFLLDASRKKKKKKKKTKKLLVLCPIAWLEGQVGRSHDTCMRSFYNQMTNGPSNAHLRSEIYKGVHLYSPRTVRIPPT